LSKQIRVLIRTAGGRDSKNEVGLGHIIRCKNLASELKGAKIWVMVEDFGGIKGVLKKEEYEKIIFLKKNESLDLDLKKTKKCIETNKIDILIIDKYKLKNVYVRKLKNYSKVIVISDLKKINYQSDLVINGFIGFKNKVIKNKFGTKCFLGPHYQILNKNFSRKKLLRKKQFNLITSFGGVDTKNLTLLLLKALVPKYINQIRTKIIIGPSNINKNKIMQYKKYKNISIIKNPKDMYKEISDSEVGICTGGLTSYEFAVLKIPFAIISDVNHQLLTAKEWKNKGYASNLEKISGKTFGRIENYLDDISKNKIKRYGIQNFVDGKGVTRVAKEILRLMN